MGAIHNTSKATRQRETLPLPVFLALLQGESVFKPAAGAAGPVVLLLDRAPWYARFSCQALGSKHATAVALNSSKVDVGCKPGSSQQSQKISG